MISGIHLDVLLAASYSIFLAAVAFLLEWLARHSHARAEHYRTSGFVYRRRMDIWECPAGRQLVRLETDYQRRIVRYRAPAHECNSCSLKANCTDSDQGRLLESLLNSWIESELYRFHRGLSLALLFLATIILLAEAVWYNGVHELILVGTLLVFITVAETRLCASFFTRHGS